LLPQLDRTCWVALEVTGSAFEVHDVLSPHVGRLLLANPVDLKRLGSGRHTDRVDAARLAKMLAVGTIPTVWVPPQPMREVRRLVYYRSRLASSRRRAINQAKGVVRRHGHMLPREADVQRWLTQEFLNALPAPDRVILRSACRQITVLETEIAEIEVEIARCIVDVPAVQVLLTITGVGLIVAAATWAILGDPRRFARSKQVARYAGLDPSIVQSGEQHRQGRISKAGSPLLRTLLVEAAQSLARWDTGPLGQFYTRKAQEVGSRRAIIALARKLLIVAWRMLLTGELYRAAKTAAVARKQRELQKKLTRGYAQPAPVLLSHPIGMTHLPTSYVAGTESIIRRRFRIKVPEGSGPWGFWGKHCLPEPQGYICFCLRRKSNFNILVHCEASR